MFDYTLAHWAAFFLATFLLTISPGPDIAYMLAHTVKSGQRAGFAAMFGIWTGAFLHILFAAAGLSAILATSAIAFTIVKWVGAAYLIWLGIQALRSTADSGGGPSSVSSVSFFGIYRQGVLVATLNPKVAIFFLAFLPQFVVAGAGPVSLQLFLHGALVILVAALIEPPIILLSARLANYFNQRNKFALWLDKCLGGLFIALGVRLAMTDRV